MKKNLSVFEIITETIGEENAYKLQAICGGMVFYIPIKKVELDIIKDEYNHLREIGNSHKIAVMNLAQKKEMSYRTINDKIKRKS
jgi:hypothetical protein